MAEVTVTVDDDHLDKVDEVAAALRATGLNITEVNDAIGIISGSIDAGSRAAAAEVAGVSSVEDAVSPRIPPPDSPVQ